MARSFNGTSTALTVTTAPISGGPLTMAGWVNPGAGGTNAVWVCGVSANDTSNGYILIRWRSAAGADQGKAGLNMSDFTGHNNTANSTTADTTTGTWKHIAGTLSSDNLTATAFLNGGGKNGNTIAGWDGNAYTRTNVAVIGSPGNFGATSSIIAEVGIWNVILSDTEIRALALGARCYTIRSKSLVFYCPVDGLSSPEPDFSGSKLNMSLVGSPPIANGPPITLFTPKPPILAPSVTTGITAQVIQSQDYIFSRSVRAVRY